MTGPRAGAMTMMITTRKELVDEIRLAQVTLITSTSRLLDAADEVRRHRDRLFSLLDRTTPDSVSQDGIAQEVTAHA
jgi:hypothetical protein